MNLTEAKQEVTELREKLEYYANKYYDEDKPEISDYEYDMMMNRLKALEKEYPELITKDSLTQKVGGHVKEGFKEVEHEVPLQSLQDVFSFEELKEFDERVKKQAIEENEELNYVVETRIKLCCRNKNRWFISIFRIYRWSICKRSNKRKWANRRRCNR